MKLKLFIIVLVIPYFTLAQERDSTLTDVINQGTFTGHTRSFFMATLNNNNLSDYYAVAIGSGIGYESPEIKKFKFTISGFFIFNIVSSDLSKPDPATSMLNRYEIGLFDITDPGNRNDLNRLEKLYLQYRVHKSFLRLGKMILNTPFINPQDGRMRPTLEQGLWLDINEIRNTNVQAGWVNAFSPRSTTNWFSVQNSIGIYAGGLNEAGTLSDYADNVRSKGLAILGIEHKQRVWSFSTWNTHIENVSNTIFVQLESELKNDVRKYYGGIRYIRQNAVGHGGNEDATKTYMLPGTHTNTWSSRLGWTCSNLDININATAISDGGRFLMPREWGRDPFYTFLPRERNEGYGDLQAYSLNITCTIPKTNLKASVAIGEYHLPDVTNYRLNKYAMPSYRQLNLDLSYRFSKFLEGADIQFLYVYKQGTGRDYEDPKNVLNKVNMSNFNFIFNYRFESSHAMKL